MIELHGAAHDAHRIGAVDRFDFHERVVGLRLRIVAEGEQGLDRRPLAAHRLQAFAPVGKGLRANGCGDHFAGRGAVFHERKGIGKAGIVRRFGNAEMLEGVADVGVRDHDEEADDAPVRGLVVAQEGIDGRAAGLRLAHPHHLAGVQIRSDDLTHRPHSAVEQRNVDLGGLAGLRAVVERGGNAPGQIHAADGIAHAAHAHGQRDVEFLRGQRVAKAGMDPEGSGVESAAITRWALVAIAAAAGIDDIGIRGADVLHVDLQLLACGRQVVGEKDVGGLRQLVDELLAFLGRDVDADGALAPVGVLDHRIDDRVELGAGDRKHAALRIAAHGMLDLDDVGAPVGQHGTGSRDEDELCHFQHSYALHHLLHAGLSSCTLK